MDRSNLIPLCWDCHEPLDDDRVRVRTKPNVPEWMISSTTEVCPTCAAKRAAESAPHSPDGDR